jgi:hypothetical protein
MVGEAIAGLGAIKSAFDLAKGLKDINDAAVRNAAVIELQERILAAQQAQSALVERVSELEKRVAGFEKWETEKEKYKLEEVHPKNYAYAIKESARGSEPSHLICATCYENRKRTILQPSSAVHLSCPVCKTTIQFKASQSLSGRYTGGGF